ncbi:hypothetical protein HMI46_22870 [Paenibacillus alvei]|uniref:Lipoprotein n=2 Tax=Paenibacillus TaxID=44249 RepID=A0AAP7DK05_PAEAL|nr:hypothetical protein [Paenibacillus alvei]
MKNKEQIMKKMLVFILLCMTLTACSSKDEKLSMEQLEQEQIPKVDLEKALEDIIQPVSIQEFLVLYDRYLEKSINSHMMAINGQMDFERYKYNNSISIKKISTLLSFLSKDSIENYSNEFMLEATHLVNSGVILFTDINLLQEYNDQKIKEFTNKIKGNRNELLILSKKYDAGISEDSNIDVQLIFNNNGF